MARSERDIIGALISNVSSGDMDGADTINEVTLETALDAHTLAINAIITVLEQQGIIGPN